MYTTVYLLDDNDTTNFYNLDVLKDFMPEATVECFTNSDSFIEHYKTINATGNDKILLLLDINMPDKQGFEVIEALEDNFDNLENLDIIMVSSSNLKIDREKATRYPNVFGFIEKPLTPEKLYNTTNGIF